MRQPPAHSYARTSRAGPRSGAAALLAALLVFGAAACGDDGDTTAVTDRGSDTTSSKGTSTATTAESTCTEVPPPPSEDESGSVQEPDASETYQEGTLAMTLTPRNGSDRCLTLKLDAARSGGWDVEENQIDLVYGRDDGPSVHLRTTGEPMVGSVDATLGVTFDEIDDTFALDTPGTCSFLLTDLAEHRLEGWVNCDKTGSDASVLSSARAHLTVTA